MKDFLRALLFNAFFYGLVAAGVVLTASAIATGSILMFFVGVSIALTSYFERKAVLEENAKSEYPMPGLFKSIVPMYRDVVKFFSKADKVVLATKETGEGKTETQTELKPKKPAKAKKVAKLEETEKPKEENFAKEIIDAELARKKDKITTKSTLKSHKRVHPVLNKDDGMSK